MVPLQTTQAAPARPQLPTLGVSQAACWQQPSEQFVGVQAHPPSRHTCPVWHAGPLPQVHEPCALQPSPDPWQSMQAAPAAAQAVADVAVQVAVWQQPLGHTWAVHPLQAPAKHVWSSGQTPQVPPADPQAAAVSPAWQAALASQHPDGHDLELHSHAPALHSWPVWQAGPVPHRQPPSLAQALAPRPQLVHWAPVVPQAAAVVGVTQVWSGWQQPSGQVAAVHTQLPFRQCSPTPQAAPLPQAQFPVLLQPLAVAELQTLQLPPATPQAASDWASHAPLAQQPSGQEVESQTQWPLEQRWPELHSAPLPQLQLPAEQPSERCESQTPQTWPFTPQLDWAGV